MNDSREVFAIIQLEDEQAVDKMMWTEDGQLMAISSKQGGLQVYLTKLPMLGVAFQTSIANLTSLLEVTVQDNVNNVSLIYFLFLFCVSFLRLIVEYFLWVCDTLSFLQTF